MNRSLVAGLVAVGCCALPAAAEEPAEKKADLAIYGQAHVSAEYDDDGRDTSFYLSSNSSRVGLKGWATLDYSARALWQVESQVNVDESGTQFATRNTYVGVSCPLGTALAGYYDSPFKTLGRSVDLFGDRIGDSRNITGLSGCGCDLRLQNVVLYESPRVHGVQATAAYSMEEGAAGSSVASGSVTFIGAGLLAGVAYEEHGPMLTGTDSDADGTLDTPSPTGESAVRAAAMYTLKGAQVCALCETVMDVSGVAGADRQTWGAGAAYKLGRNAIRAQVYATPGVDTVSGVGATLYAAGFDRKVGDSTTLYVAGALMENEFASRLRATAGGHGDKVTPLAGGDATSVAVGIIHNF